MNRNYPETILAQNTQFVKPKLQARRGQSAAAAARQEAFSLLVEISPECAALLAEARTLRQQFKRQNLEGIFYAEFKPRLKELAGWTACNPSLRFEEAYDLLYETICAALGVYCVHNSASAELDAMRRAYGDALAASKAAQTATILPEAAGSPDATDAAPQSRRIPAATIRRCYDRSTANH